MMLVLFAYLLVAVSLAGHAALWGMLYNRLHALPLPCRGIQTIEKIFVLLALAIPAWLAWRLSELGGELSRADWIVKDPGMALYALLCWASGLYVASSWVARRRASAPAHVVSNHTQVIDVAQQLGHAPLNGWAIRGWAALPGNQILHLAIQDKTLVLPRLDPQLAGLSIVQLSDLHFTGRITPDFFNYVVDRTNELEPDLVAITGDILDKAACLSWIVPVLGRLRSSLGTYAVLGNHDQRIGDVAAIRRLLGEAGIHYLGGRWTTVETRGRTLVVAGNERPWFGPAPDMSDCPQGHFRLLLAHTPDQIAWARRHQFDLMLAGHTHGGQVRVPNVGAIVCPSLYGVRYAAGVFYLEPTLMHVSRGLSGLHPIRYHCPPELTRIVLRPAASPTRTAGPRAAEV